MTPEELTIIIQALAALGVRVDQARPLVALLERLTAQLEGRT